MEGKGLSMNVTEVAANACEVRNVSWWSGKENVMRIPLGYDAFMERLDKWQAGEMIQRAFPTLNADQREFIMNGVTPEEWRKYFG